MMLEEFILNNLAIIPLVVVFILLAVFLVISLLKRVFPSKKRIEEAITSKALELEKEISLMNKNEKIEFFLNDPRASLLYEIYNIPSSKEETVPEKLLSLSNKEIAFALAKREVSSRILTFRLWLPVFFVVLSLLGLFFYIIFRWIQILILGSQQSMFLFVEGWGMFISPIILFTILFGGGVLDYVVGRSFVIKKLGREYYYPSYSAGLGKKGARLLMTAGLFLLPVIFLCMFHYTRITDDGIFINRWFSLKERFYQWQDIERIYQEKARILKTNKIKFYKKRFIVVFFRDGSKFAFDPFGNMNELYGKRKEAIEFVITKSGVGLEEKVYDARIKKYIDYNTLTF